MNWEAIGAIGEIVGAEAVVITLIFLTVQLRLEVEAKLIAGGISQLSNEEIMFARHHHIANAVRLDNGLFQYRNGFLDDDYLEYVESVIQVAYPLWKLLGIFDIGFRPEFRRLVKEIYERRTKAVELSNGL